MHLDFLKKRLWVWSGRFLWVLRSFWEHLFLENTSCDCFRGNNLPALFWKSKKVPWYWRKKYPDIVHFWVKFSIEGVVWVSSRKKCPIFFLRSLFLSFFFFNKILIQVLWFHKTSPTRKKFWLCAWVWYVLSLF